MALPTAPLLLMLVGGSGEVTDETIDFARDVRPLLSDRCFACHGPDAGTRKAGLRLDTREGALAPLGSGGHAVVPGDVDASEVGYRISTEFDFERMPPPETGAPLTPEEVETLERWIAEGAPWGEHWSFVPPTRPEPPRSDVSPIDAFVLERLAGSGLEPTPPADPDTLLRRVSLDLTGLQPRPGERHQFAMRLRQDGLDAAYTEAVERLLASPAYGEHMARTWLDAARYADTHGLHLDNRRSMWPYRDWVVEAFNTNVPFDDFTRMQLAGDLLPEPTQADLVASGFNRCNPTSAEGGMIAEEYLSIYAKDRADTTASVFLGLTLSCAQCHDHKFDPLSQRDYYGMYAFFNSLGEEASDRNVENPQPFVRVASPGEQEQLDRYAADIARLDPIVDAPRPDWDAAEELWFEELRADGRRWGVLIPAGVRTTGGETVEIDRTTGVVEIGGANPDKTVYEVDLWVPPGAFSDLRLDALVPDGQELPGRADNQNFVLTHAEVRHRPLGPHGPMRTGLSEVLATYSQPNWNIAGVLDPAGNTGWAGLERTGDRSAFLRLGHTFDSSAADEPIPPPYGGTALTLRLAFESPYARHALARFRVAVRRTALAEQTPNPLGLELALHRGVPASELLAPERAALRRAWRAIHAPEWTRAHDERERLRTARERLQATLPTTLVSRELDERRPAFVQRRGAYDDLGEEVAPAVPAVLPPLPADVPADRLALANWIVAPENPLTARVQVNRAWQHFFGRGLVATPEDFGAQGAWPSHPGLLDWLATEFVASGWDVKELHRTIVQSDAYRRSSRAGASLRTADPDNVLLARGPRHRLDGEVVRDAALFAAGLLDRTPGGPGVRPYQPDGVWFAVGYSGSNTVRYEQGPPNHLHRRSLYTFWKRTAPPPNLAAFDAPSREACTVRRERTNTPLQALVTLNDPTFVEAARFLAQRVLYTDPEGPDVPDTLRVRRMVEYVLARETEAHEVELLLDLAAGLEAEYRADPEAAQALLGVGDTAPHASMDPARLAAWTLVASTVLNLDEALNKE